MTSVFTRRSAPAPGSHLIPLPPPPLLTPTTVYGLQYSDKTSLSSGVVFGLVQDTHLVGNQYANLTSFFYMAYGVAQIPMGYLMQRFPLGRALSVCIVLWGGMVMLLAACNNYASLAAVRTFLGWFEAVVTPGFAVLTASWYLRSEQTLRQGMYYAMNTFFSIVFGIGIYFLALNAERHGGLAAWRVINLFLGGTTVGMGLVAFAFVGTPGEVWWLSKREKRMAHARIIQNATGGGEQHPWKWEQVRECLRDRQFYHAILYNFLSCVPNGGLGAFQTLIFKSLGFTSLEAILYGQPSNAIGCVTIIVSATTVRYCPRMRFPIALACQFVAIFSFLFTGLGSHLDRWARWAVFSFVSVFAVSTFMVWPLLTVNIAGRTKKSFFAAVSLLSYCVGNIVGSQIFIPKDAPLYLHGMTACAIVMAVNAVNLSLWWRYYVTTNRAREAAFQASGLTEEDRAHETRIAGETDMTDKQVSDGAVRRCSETVQ
ncbi:hypothetical protein VHUM_01215 [Vanrija humicola]|uniref:Major facilitator superfamily (MFS) profile domain-containing protein n=1 Tax=Vanrija humicola TaxID=5417 RepID=A0A7D8Z4X0_VANHU|nr:hypothetical protein VHUM_01215 [Vanrija humicola]